MNFIHIYKFIIFINHCNSSMNFFEDDFGFGDSPRKPSKKPPQPKYTNF